MDFKQYQYVLKIAELQNLTRAANELHITQPSLSHYIARIEEEMGAPLFNRTTNPISLTAAGERYVETARIILQLNHRLRQDITDIADNRKGNLYIGISHARASYFLPYVLPAFKKEYPGIDVRTREQRADLIVQSVLRGDCDLGILPFPVPDHDGRLDMEEICRERLLLISGKPLTDRTFVDLSDYQDAQFSLLKKGHGIRTALDVLFMEAGVSPKNIFETTSNETAYRLATAGMGLSIVPKSTIHLSQPIGPHYQYDLREGGFYWTIGVIYRSKEMLTAAQEDFIEMMKAIFGKGID